MKIANNIKYWLAGLLEGEGSFMKGPPSRPNQPCVSIEMTDREPVQKVAKIFNLMPAALKARKKTWKATYRVRIRGNTAIRLMKILRPLMSPRRQQQIKEALKGAKIRERKLVTTKEARRMVALRERGLSYRAIGGIMGWDKATIWKHLRNR